MFQPGWTTRYAPDVVGKPLDRNIASEVVKAAAGDPKVMLHLEYVDRAV